MCKLYNTWRKVKDTFVKPSLKVYFGKWKNDPNLPVYRSGGLIWFCSRKHRHQKTHIVEDAKLICTGTKTFSYPEGGSYNSKVYEWAPAHKLPGKLEVGDFVWTSKIRRKLRKWHLGWLPPVIVLPIWLRFHIVNLDVVWKTKYDDIRYEYPPQFSIVFFGLSLTFTLHCPIEDKYCNDDSYWEAILLHLYKNKSGNLKETVEQAGVWHRFSDDCRYFALRPKYIVKEKQEEYYAAISDLKVKSRYMNTI